LDQRLVDNEGQGRFELYLDGDQAGFLEYHRYGNEIALLHTEVDQRFRGQGIGGSLVECVLDKAKGEGLAVLPFCSYVRRWMGEHPDTVALVPQEQRDRFGF
jgi:predicted GNAT family acetyltransferase